jgi:phage shock protein E
MANTQMNLNDFYNQHQKLGKNDVILDVRRPDEFAQGHIPGALNIPVDQVSEHTASLKKYDQIYIHCKRGGRAKTAFETLNQAGLTNLVCIFDAGMDQWIESGYPVSRD